MCFEDAAEELGERKKGEARRRGSAAALGPSLGEVGQYKLELGCRLCVTASVFAGSLSCD